ncbi:hypothetical protein I5U67_00135 [Stenotrophomonas maltophilia]|uniref:Secreted protein n=1 Tax=Stenotrophomonas maltophilia TaxID=40324 RepID=A0AA89W6C3_STEMA|nr:hypothetical protein [Stenotrophomonas maltophilia]MBH1650606.1 hypothetical protein [Stenotrophomonas maltophilia]HDS1508522.1 hypothetical protein [Stenotrophomonas maltophilia]
MAALRLRKPTVSLRCCLPLLCALAAPSAFATSLDLPALIECRQGVAEQAALAPLLADPLKAVAQGLQPLPQGNQFMSEFRLASPITVFGQQTERVAVAGASVMAVLDQADPRPLAKRLALETGYDQDGKFMAGRELVSRDVTDPKTGEAQIESIILSVSTVASHPGKTLAGCTYSLDLPEEEPDPGAPTPATGSH